LSLVSELLLLIGDRTSLTGFLVPRQKASPSPFPGTLVKVINRNCFGKRLKG